MEQNERNELLKRQITALFDDIAGGFDNPSQRFFPFAADRLVDHLKPRRNEKVLDAATGTGAVAVGAAQAVGPGGRIMAVDLSERMMDRAFANVSKMALDNVDLHDMDVEDLAFRSGYFDAVACGLAVFLFPSPERAAAQWHRVLKPGGRVVFSAFGPDAFSPLLEDLTDRLEALGYPPDTRFFRRMDEAQCRALLEGAGFEGVAVHREQLGYHLANTIDWFEVVRHTSIGAFLRSLPPDVGKAIERAHTEHVEQGRTDDGLWINVDVLFAEGRRP